MAIPALCRHIGPNGLNHCPYRDGRTGPPCRFTHRGDPGFEEKFLATHNRPFEGLDAMSRDRPDDRRQYPVISTSASRQTRPLSPPRVPRRPSGSSTQTVPAGKPPPDPPSQPKVDRGPSSRGSSYERNSGSNQALMTRPDSSARPMEHSAPPRPPASPKSGSTNQAPMRSETQSNADPSLHQQTRPEDKSEPADPANAEGASMARIDPPDNPMPPSKVVRPRERAICQLVDVLSMRLEQVRLKKEADVLEALETQAKLARMDPQNLAVLEERNRESRHSLQRMVLVMESRIRELAALHKGSIESALNANSEVSSSQLDPHLEAIRRIGKEVQDLKQDLEEHLKSRVEASDQLSNPLESTTEQDGMDIDSGTRSYKCPRDSEADNGSLPAHNDSHALDQPSWEKLFNDLRAKIADLEQVQDDLTNEVADGYNKLDSKISDVFEEISEQRFNPVPKSLIKTTQHNPSTVSQEEVEMLVTTISETRDALNVLQVRLDTIQLEKLRQENDQLTRRLHDLEQVMEKRKEEKTALSAVVLALSSQTSAHLHASAYATKLKEEITRDVISRIQPHLRVLLQRNKQFLHQEQEKMHGSLEGRSA